MAYLADAFGPTGGGLAAVLYDDGAVSHLAGVKYDDGGRLRVLLGQDSTDMLPPDVGVDPNLTSAFPISYSGPSIAPTLLPYIPSPTVDTVNTEPTGALIPPAAAPAPITGSILTDILNAAKTIVPLAAGVSTGASAGVAIPPGYVRTASGQLVPATGTVGTSWFSQASIISGLPNWGVLAIGGVGVAVLLGVLGASSSGGSSGRRRNPAELILMGANPSRRNSVNRYAVYKDNVLHSVKASLNAADRQAEKLRHAGYSAQVVGPRQFFNKKL